VSVRKTLRRIRESIGRATISVPGLFPMTIQLDRDERKVESLLVKVTRDGGEWWKDKPDEPRQT
jgi:hypothetical protein